MNKDSRIYVAGHSGMVGSALCRKLIELGFTNLLKKSSQELNLLRQAEVEAFFEQEKPDYVIVAAAKVGGIYANNTLRADFIYENLTIQNNVIHAAHKNHVKKLIFLGSSCIYPKNAPQPLKEEYLLTGILEETNEPYAIAKIAGIKMCENYYHQYGSNFISFMPTNMYGLNDNYDLSTSHVIPALLRKIHLAKLLEQNDLHGILLDFKKHPMQEFKLVNSMVEVEKVLTNFGILKNDSAVSVKLWGNGESLREFLLVDDFVAICLELSEKIEAKQLYSELNKTHINIGSGKEISIENLALLIKEVVEFSGNIIWGGNTLNGTAKKCLDVSLMESLTTHKSMTLRQGLIQTYKTYRD